MTMNHDRQVHKACADVIAICDETLTMLTGTPDRLAVEHQVRKTRHATHLLSQMVGTPIERRQRWSWYRPQIDEEFGL
jgi:hypothetical protein